MKPARARLRGSSASSGPIVVGGWAGESSRHRLGGLLRHAVFDFPEGAGTPSRGAPLTPLEAPTPLPGHREGSIPHKGYGPQNNDLALNLRKHGIGKVVLAGMSANLCVESHMRDLIEQGFEVFVVGDATAAARHPELGDGYEAAMVNFKYIASEVLTTQEAVDALS